MECPICVSTINKSNHVVQCGYCDFTSCVKCNKEFFKTQTNARCMNMECKKEFTRQFLITNFNKTYINTEYKSHLKDIYFQKEVSKLPETICIINACNTHDARTKELRRQKSELKIQKEELKRNGSPTYHNIRSQYIFIKRLHMLYEYCFRLQHYITNEPTTIEEIDIYYNELMVSGKKKYIPKYIGRCPVENCKGFINTEFICELCMCHICEKCNIPLPTPTTESSSVETPQHICDENTVSTIQLLKKDTKPCPNCHVQIFKIDGCDQMWCIECHTAFSWTTGEVEHKIHNPHYYEYLRNTNQQDKLLELHNNQQQQRQQNACNPDEEEYDILIDFPIVVREVFYNLSIYHAYSNEIKQLRDVFIGVERTIHHIEQYEIPRNFNIQFPTHHLDSMRVDYALNKVTEKDYKRNITTLYKKQSYNEDITQLLQTFIIILKDLLKLNISTLILEKNTLTFENLEPMRRSFIDVYKWLDSKFEEIATLFGYSPVCLTHDRYFPGCTIKHKSRADPEFIGETGFYIIY